MFINCHYVTLVTKFDVMLPKISEVKGIHPGAILKRELKKRGLKNKELAASINEHAQTLSAILNEKRGINSKLSIKLGLEFEVDYFMILQANYEVKSLISPDRNIETTKFYKLRKSLFWDTDFDNIDWSDNKTAVIKRIFERGNEAEIEEIIDYYGSGVVKEELKHLNNEFLPSFNYNVKKFAPKTKN